MIAWRSLIDRAKPVLQESRHGNRGRQEALQTLLPAWLIPTYKRRARRARPVENRLLELPFPVVAEVLQFIPEGSGNRV